MAGLKAFKEKLKQDAAFAEEAKKCRSFDELIDFASEQGFDLSAEEIEELTDLRPDELSGVAGGMSIDPQPNLEILVSAHHLFNKMQ